MLFREQGDNAASFSVVGEALQDFGDACDEAPVGALEHERERTTRLQPGVGDARVVERPRAQLLHELLRKGAKRRAFGARQHDHHGGPMGQAIVEQIAGQSLVAGAVA